LQPAPSATAAPTLAVEHVTHAFGAHRVLDDVSLSLAPGAIAALLGPSGCGKTTLLRLIAGFESLQAGSIDLAGVAASRPRMTVPPERRRIGMVFQDFALFPHLDVAANIAFGLVRQDTELRHRRVTELLSLVGLEGLQGRYPHELSGGQQQRVALARALANRPPLVLLDEPFSSLDGDLRERLAGEVRQVLLHEKAAAILVTHDQFEAFAFADVVGVMERGRVAQWDSAPGLYDSPSSGFVARFIGDGALLAGRGCPEGIRTVMGIVPVREPSVRDGDSAEVLLRPDDVELAPCGGVEAEVTSRAFRGSAVMLRLRLPDGATVLVLAPATSECTTRSRVRIRLRSGVAPRAAFRISPQQP
jgi:iron(III) transport system ATP-binding protein